MGSSSSVIATSLRAENSEDMVEIINNNNDPTRNWTLAEREEEQQDVESDFVYECASEDSQETGVLKFQDIPSMSQYEDFFCGIRKNQWKFSGDVVVFYANID